MKYLDFPELNRLSQALCHEGECSVRTRIEAYSCKPIARDKRLLKSLESAWTDELAHSPPPPSFIEPEAELATPFGPIDARASRRTLFALIQTLNVAFPDHEFSDVRPAHFAREPSGAGVLGALSTTLVSPSRAGLRAPRTYSAYPPTSPDLFPHSVPTSSSPRALRPSPRAPPPVVSGTHPTLFRILDDAIALTDCEVYSYEPDLASDPHANDDDDECDAASVDEYSDDEDADEDGGFAFDFDEEFSEDESVKVAKAPRKRRAGASSKSSGGSATKSSAGGRNNRSESVRIPKTTPAASWPTHVRMRRRGALLWSSHWFFLNRKLKRILFISVWSRTRGLPSWRDGSDESSEGSAASSSTSPEREFGDRFRGWAGGVGAGARAMGLHAWD